MKFFLETERLDLNFEIEHGTKIVLMGSCFSDELHPYFTNAGFEVLSNPFGTLFHPVVIADEIENSIDGNNELDICKRGDEYLSWSASGSIVESSKESLVNSIKARRNNLKHFLEGKTVLIITLGTAWGYRHKELNKIVGNCHKAEQSTFEKELTSLEVLQDRYNKLSEKLKHYNPDLKVIFTVSPVRHKRDGLVGNNRSKARLIELLHSLNFSYFPSYEIVLDELRDYRFYKEDLVHPNKSAVSVVWDRLSEVLFSSECQNVVKEVTRVNAMRDHRPLNDTSSAHLKMKLDIENRIEDLTRFDSRIYWQKK
jgi:hypothetical protein